MDERREPLPRGVWWSATGLVVFLLSVAGRYGFHRDELYFIVAGRRLDWGYVDQPPFTPLLARISETVGGTTPVALRVFPALAIGAVAVLGAAMARQFGGGSRAQVYAGVASGGAGVALAFGHLLSTATFDYLFSTIALWLVIRVLGGESPRLWIGVGAAVGVGLQNKHLIGVLAVAVLVALLMSRQRRLLASPWPWLGAGLAAVIALPNLLWQAANDFPQLEMARSLAGRSDGPVAFVVLQIALLSIVLAVPAVAGLWRLARAGEMERWRPLAGVFAILFVLYLATGGKAYYLAPLYPVLLAAGSIWVERLASPRRMAMVGLAAVGMAAGSVISLPLLPPTALSVVDATGELGETVGWPELIDQVSAVYESLPIDLRQDAAIFTGSYGEAGAIDVLGPQRGLPKAASGHNNYWLWGPPVGHSSIIGVGDIGALLAPICPDLRQVDTITNPYGVQNEEMGLPIYLCELPTGTLADIWPTVRHYN